MINIILKKIDLEVIRMFVVINRIIVKKGYVK